MCRFEAKRGLTTLAQQSVVKSRSVQYAKHRCLEFPWLLSRGAFHLLLQEVLCIPKRRAGTGNLIPGSQAASPE